MKLSASKGRKLKYGGMSLALTALIIAAVIIVNVIFSALAQKFLWYVDLTPELLFTLSDEAYELIEKGDATLEDSLSPIEMVDKARAEKKAADPSFDPSSLTINIIFCVEPDELESNTSQRYVYYTARELEQKFPDHIKVECYNVVHNPSLVSRFKENSLSTIAPDSVIIEFGTEYRIRTLKSFYTFNDAQSDTPWAYNGEKAFVSSILAVTRAESPIACLTTNHGEVFTDTAFYNTLVDAGYVVQPLDLAKDAIPDKCRLIVVFNPLSDFTVAEKNVSDIDEIEKLDAFLDGTNSLMVFMDPETKRLDNFEEYLEEWGIKFDRHTNAYGEEISHHVMDKTQALTSDGYTFRAEYVTAGVGSSFTETLRSRGVAPSIIFKNAMSISYSDMYAPTHYTPAEGETGVSYDYGDYAQNGVYRKIYDIFKTSSGAKSYAGNLATEVDVASDTNTISLMTVSVEQRTTQESNYSTISEASYVIACGSTQFASDALLTSSSYGNTDFLLSAMRTIGSEPVPVGLLPNPFSDKDIDDITTVEATRYTVILALVPLFAAACTGVVILVRRKNR